MKKLRKSFFFGFFLIGLLFLLPKENALAARGGEYLTDATQIKKRLQSLKKGDEWTFILKQDCTISDCYLIDSELKITFQGNGHTLYMKDEGCFYVRDNTTLNFKGGNGGLKVVGSKMDPNYNFAYLMYGSKLVCSGNVELRKFELGRKSMFELNGASLMLFDTKIHNCFSETQSLIRANYDSLVYMKNTDIRECMNAESVLHLEDTDCILYNTKISASRSLSGTIHMYSSKHDPKRMLYMNGCTLAYNESDTASGGLNLEKSQSVLVNTVIYKNRSWASDSNTAGGILIHKDADLTLGGRIVIRENQYDSSGYTDSDIVFRGYDEIREIKNPIITKKLAPTSRIGLLLPNSLTFTRGYRESGNTLHPSKIFFSNHGRYRLRYNTDYLREGTEAAIVLAPLSIREPKLHPYGIGKVKIDWHGYMADGFYVYRKIGNGQVKLLANTRFRDYTDFTASSTEFNYYRVVPYLIDYDGTIIKGGEAAFLSIKADRLGAVNTLTARQPAKKQAFELNWDAVYDAEGYLIYRTKGSGSPIYFGLTKSCVFTDENVEADISYTYQVYAYRKLPNGKMMIGAPGKPVTIKGMYFPGGPVQ